MPHSLSDAELIARVKAAAANERDATAVLIALLAELGERRLYLEQGCSSLFTYCTQVLRLSEHAAYGRIAAARASRRWPEILRLLANGDLNLTTVVLLAPHLTSENHEAVLDMARDKTKSEIERLIAALHPQPDIEARVRRLPTPTSPPAMIVGTPVAAANEAPTVAPLQRPCAPAARPVVAPLAPARYLIKVTVSADAHANLTRARDLLRHTIPNGDPAAIVERALALFVNHLERSRQARVEKPSAKPKCRATAKRHVPAAVRRAVWARDGGRCAFVGSEGRCTETGFLELHHIQPFADRGPTTTENLTLRCRSHNMHEARVWDGLVYFIACAIAAAAIGAINA